MKRRVDILLPDLGGGGAERVAVTLAAEFVRRGYRVTILLQEAKGELLSALPEGVGVHAFGRRRVRDLLRPLVAHLRQNRPDALLAVMWPLTAVAVVAAKLVGGRTRVVTSDHGTLSNHYRDHGALHGLLLRRSIQLTYPRAAARVQVSTGSAADLEELGRLPKGSVSVIHNPVPAPTEQTGSRVEAAKAWAGGGRRILAVGSLIPIKNHELLLRAFARLPRESGASLLLLGDGPQRATLEQLAGDLGVSERVAMPGFVPDTAPFYAAAHLFVLCSDSEALPTVLIEALHAGLPIVSTDCPHGPREILNQPELGTLVPTGDEEALARAMEDGLQRPHDPAALIARGADFAGPAAFDAYERLLFGDERISGVDAGQ